MKKVYIILIVVIVAIGAGLLIGLNMYNKAPSETRTMKVDATVDIATITSEFKNDSSKARKKYGNMAVIVLKGKVDKVVAASGQYHVNFSGNNVNIDCLVSHSDSAKAATVTAGQDIQIKGKYSGYLLDEIVDPQPQLQLKDCIIQ
jgi:ABC-type Na+ efflux pump permease subunit